MDIKITKTTAPKAKPQKGESSASVTFSLTICSL